MRNLLKKLAVVAYVACMFYLIARLLHTLLGALGVRLDERDWRHHIAFAVVFSAATFGVRSVAHRLPLPFAGALKDPWSYETGLFVGLASGSPAGP